MFNVVIVDDEKSFRDDLGGMVDWGSLGLRVIGMARNGREALRLCRESTPEIVIADIKMPVMDGLELARSIRAVDSTTAIILLTAYRDPDFAIEAVNTGVTRYLVKHLIDPDVLRGQLSQIVESLRAQYRSDVVILNELLSEARTTSDGAGEIARVLSRLHIPVENSLHAFITVLFDPRSAGTMGDPPALETGDLRDDSLSPSIPLPSEGKCLVLESSSRGMCLLSACTNDTRKRSEECARIDEYVRCLRMHLERWGRAPAGIGVSDVFQGTYDMRRQGGIARRRASESLYQDGGAAVFQDPPVLDDARSACSVARVAAAVGRMDLAEAEREIRGLFSSLRDPTDARRMAADVSECIAAFLLDRHIPARPVLGDGVDFMSLGTASGFTGHFVQVLARATHALGLPDTSHCGMKVHEAAAFILGNYARDDLSVQQIAAAVGCSGAHLCRVFHRETGCTLLRFVTRCRVEKAKWFLRRTEDLVYEVAAKTGFTSAQYFSALFKLETGMSPLEYRNAPQREVDAPTHQRGDGPLDSPGTL